MVTAFRIAQISDLHIALTPFRVQHSFGSSMNPKARRSFFQTSHDIDVLLRLRHHLGTRRREIDILLVSGDIAATGTRADLWRARDLIVTPTSVVSQFAETPPLSYVAAKFPIFMVPGNHDRFKNDVGVPGGKDFDSVFGACWGGGLRGVYARKYPDKGQVDELVLIGADFCFSAISPKHAAFWRLPGQGIVCTDVLSKLREKTLSVIARFPNAGIVWVIHFPPIPRSKLRRRERCLLLRQGEKLLALAGECGIGLILAGHLHRNSADFLHNSTRVWCAGSASSMDYIDHQFIHEIKITVNGRGGALAERDFYRWHPDNGGAVY